MPYNPNQPPDNVYAPAPRREHPSWYNRSMDTAQQSMNALSSGGQQERRPGLLDRAISAAAIYGKKDGGGLAGAAKELIPDTGLLGAAKTGLSALAGGGSAAIPLAAGGLGATGAAAGSVGGTPLWTMVPGANFGAGAAGGAAGGASGAGATSLAGALGGVGLVASVPLIAKGVNAFGDWVGSKIPTSMYGYDPHGADWDSYVYWLSNQPGGQQPTEEGFQSYLGNP